MTTILLVDNNKNHRLLYEQELRFEGYEIVTATDGKDVLKKVQEQPLDLVVMDINLPKMDGIETMVWILSKHKNIPIIINTAYSSYKDNLMTRAADAFIVKSSDLTELKNKIKELIINKSQRFQSKVPMNNSTEKRKYERIELEERKNRGIEKHFMARFSVKPYHHQISLDCIKKLVDCVEQFNKDKIDADSTFKIQKQILTDEIEDEELLEFAIENLDDLFLYH